MTQRHGIPQARATQSLKVVWIGRIMEGQSRTGGSDAQWARHSGKVE